jgi:hypothetical protein
MRVRIFYTFGLGMNTVLKRNGEELLQTAVETFEHTGEKQRLFHGFWYQAGSWPAARYTIVIVALSGSLPGGAHVLLRSPASRLSNDLYRAA